MNDDNSTVAEFEWHRDRLFGVAYRMTGSVADAHDVCQDAWLRWQGVDTTTVENAEAYLVRIVTRLAIDRSQRASARRETYVGPFLPEPLIDDGYDERVQPEGAAELADSLTFAFLVLLDELTPVERAVFLLHDVFSYTFEEIATIVEREPAACRQIASRTRRRLPTHAGALRRVDTTTEQAMITRLITLVSNGDVAGLMTMLAPDVVQLDDAGPLRSAARKPIVGPDRVARFLVNIAKRIPPTMTMEFATVNEQQGLVFRLHGVPDMVMTFEFTPEEQVRRVFVQMNREKLAHLA